MSLEGLSAEQKKRIKGCKNLKELMNLSESEGFSISNEMLEGVSGGEGGITCLPFILEGRDLTDEDLEGISGGAIANDGVEARRQHSCIICGSADTTYERRTKCDDGSWIAEFRCNSCGADFWVNSNE